MSTDSLRGKLLTVLSRDQPPENPIIAPGWAGIAFDRNRYSDLAPADVWSVWLGVHVRRSTASSAVGIVSEDELALGHTGVKVTPSLASLRSYWMEDSRFLRDHFVFAPDFTWVVRLDQDVTLFAAERDFMDEVVAHLHGLDCVMERMIEDFDPGEGDPEGLMRYLVDITRGTGA
jgi:hypothetical protein